MALDTVTHADARNATGNRAMSREYLNACGKNDNQSLRNGSYRKGSGDRVVISFVLARTFFETRS